MKIRMSSATSKRWNIGKPWSKSDIRTLRRLYPHNYDYRLAGIFGRTIEAVRAEARSLKLKKEFDDDFKPERQFETKRWSSGEIKILKRMYPKHTFEEISDVLYRSLQAIGYKAKQLNLRKVSPWTKSEDVFLRRVHMKKTYPEIARAIGRTVIAVAKRARALGIASKTARVRGIPIVRWTKKECDLLIRYYPTTSSVELSKLIGHPPANIRTKAYLLGIKRNVKSQSWTKREDDLIRKYSSKMYYQDLAVKLGRTYSAVAGRVRTLELVKSSVWTDKDTRLLKREFRKGVSGRKIARLLGRDTGSCCYKIKALGLRRS